MSKNAVIYARFSSNHQREESIDGQIRECTEYAKRNDIKVIGTYIDRALSAKTDNRPQFRQMILDSIKEKFEFVIVYQLDRFSRNRFDSATYKNKLKKNGVRVLSAKENLNDDPSGIILESVLEGMAEYYSAELAQKVLRGMTENALKGKWPGGPIPLGYQVAKDKTLVIDERAAEGVRMTYKMYLDGCTIKTIIDTLNASGYRNSFGNQFSRSSLDSVLKNERYTGVFVWKSIRIEGAIPPIITKKQFDEVQEMKGHKKRYSPSEQYALTTKLFCGKCGSNMIGLSGTSVNGERYYYYVCSAKRRDHACDAKNIKRDELEDLIVEQTSNLLEDDTAIAYIAKQAVAAQEDDSSTIKIDTLKLEIKATETKLNNSIKLVEQGVISATIGKNIEQYETELAELNSALDKEELADNPFVLTEEAILFFLHKLKSDKTKSEFKNNIIDTFIRKVIILKDGIEIQYNYKKELPILDDVKVLDSSFVMGVVGDDRIELPTSCL